MLDIRLEDNPYGQTWSDGDSQAFERGECYSGFPGGSIIRIPVQKHF